MSINENALDTESALNELSGFVRKKVGGKQKA